MTRVFSFGEPGSVRRRLATFSIAMSMLMVTITAVSLTGLAIQEQQAERATTLLMPSYDANRAVRQTMSEAQASLRGYMVLVRAGTSETTAAGPVDGVGGPMSADASNLLRPFTAAAGRIQDELRTVDEFLADPALAQPEQLSGMRAVQAQQRAAIDNWWAYARHAAANPLLSSAQFENGDRLFEKVRSSSDRLSGLIGAERQQLRDSLPAAASRTGTAVLVATAIALGLSLLAGWRTTASLTNPISRLRSTVSRQRGGDRTAWARTDTGAVEVRALAEDVNALTAAYHGLIDGQSQSLALQRAGLEVTRRLQDAQDLRTALSVVTQGVGRALRVDQTICAAFDETLRLTDAIHWTETTGATPYAAPERVVEGIGRIAVRLWSKERTVVAPDVLTADFENEDERAVVHAVQSRGGLAAVIFGLGTRPIGSLTVHSDAVREFTDAEAAFLTQVSGELARHVTKAEAERDRAEYVALLEALDQQKDAFLSTVSHELRTPLTSINGYLEMLGDGEAGDLTAMQRKMLDVVGRNATRLRGLIEDLLVLNRMDATISDAHPRLCLRDIVLHSVEELLPAAQAGRIDLWVGTDDAGHVRGDAGQLSRVMSNLLCNAVKFTPAGGSVRVQLRRRDDRVEVSVVDTGMGIPQDEQHELFTRFYRASNAQFAQIPGTGLGLAIVKGIVERHGGSLELESSVGTGTTMRVLLPLSQESEPVGAVAAV